jgi:hypothetical protein
MKNISDRKLLKTLEEISDNFKVIIEMDMGYAYLQSVLSYVLSKTGQNDRIKVQDILVDKLSKEVGEKLMKSVLDHSKAEGKAEGKTEGKAEAMESVAREMLAEGYDASSISKFTKLDESFILALSGSNKTRQKNTHQPKHS